MDNIKEIQELSEQEANFCLLYVNGTAPYAGDAARCYKEIYGGDDTALGKSKTAWEAKKLLEKEVVVERIAELQKVNLLDAANLKHKITTTMLKVMDECSTRQFEDRFGTVLSPAAMRSVSVSAAKVIEDVNGLKEDTIQKIQIGNENGQGITFNLIVPDKNAEEQEGE